MLRQLLGAASIARMQRPLTVIALLGALIGTGTFAHSQNRTISGRVVAYNSPLTCLNGNAYWAMIVRVENAAKKLSEFVRVNFSQPCNVSPTWLDSGAVRQYRLIREEYRDEILSEFFKCEPEHSENQSEPCAQVAAWKRVRGTEQEQLPYGSTVPSYRAADLPLVPVV